MVLLYQTMYFRSTQFVQFFENVVNVNAKKGKTKQKKNLESKRFARIKIFFIEMFFLAES